MMYKIMRLSIMSIDTPEFLEQAVASFIKEYVDVFQFPEIIIRHGDKTENIALNRAEYREYLLNELGV